ncbi:hypothetical protein ACWCQK_27710 [Streptomyces sp. NPDC002306]
MIHRRAAVALLGAPLLITGCGGGIAAAGRRTTDNRPAPATSSDPRPDADGPSSSPAGPAGIAGLGPKRSAEIPDRCRQAVVVTGRGVDSPVSSVVLHTRTTDGWQAGATWPAHNALHGWSAHHVLDDLRSPLGVYTLSDAGGLLPDPGSKLPYHHSGGFVSPGTGFQGEPLQGSFDYVVAIDYNRVPGTSPLDWTRPLGPRRGGGVWLHVDHGGPTHACVSVAKGHMKELVRILDPARHPVVVMGHATWLSA